MGLRQDNFLVEQFFEARMGLGNNCLEILDQPLREPLPPLPAT